MPSPERAALRKASRRIVGLPFALLQGDGARATPLAPLHALRAARLLGKAAAHSDGGRLLEARDALLALRRAVAVPLSIRHRPLLATRLEALLLLADVAWRLGERNLAREAATEWLQVLEAAGAASAVPPGSASERDLRRSEQWIRDLLRRVGPADGS